MTICNICDNNLEFHLDFSHKSHEVFSFREGLVCEKCKSISRDRLIIWALCNITHNEDNLSKIPQNKEIRLLEATGYRGHPHILQKKFDYCNNSFGAWRDITTTSRPHLESDFQHLPFKDNYFDVVISSEVFEHIRLIDKALSEVSRVLKDGGYMIMTIPYLYNHKNTVISIEPCNDLDFFYLPPSLHAGDTIEYRAYAKDFFEKLNYFGFNVCHVRVQISDYGISQQDLFICRKGKKPDLEFLDKNNIDTFVYENVNLSSNLNKITEKFGIEFMSILYQNHIDDSVKKFLKMRIIDDLNEEQNLKSLNKDIYNKSLEKIIKLKNYQILHLETTLHNFSQEGKLSNMDEPVVKKMIKEREEAILEIKQGITWKVLDKISKLRGKFKVDKKHDKHIKR